MPKPPLILPEEGEELDIELEEDFIKANERLASINRRMLDRRGVKAVDFMGSIGSGKTSLLERLVDLLKDRYRIGVIAGDTTTDIDASRIARHGVSSVQVNTGKECHLDALLVRRALKKLLGKKVDLIFIENVGNLICPADFPVGAHKRVVVVSVTEGEYVIVKKRDIFLAANVAVINKIDLADAMGVDPAKLAQDARKANPAIKAVLTSAKFNQGIEELARALELI